MTRMDFKGTLNESSSWDAMYLNEELSKRESMCLSNQYMCSINKCNGALQFIKNNLGHLKQHKKTSIS